MPSQESGDLATTVAANIRARRLAQGLTQRQVAEAVEVDQMVVSKWERGRHTPSQENIIRLAELLGVTVAWLYTEGIEQVDPEKVVRRYRETAA